MTDRTSALRQARRRRALELKAAAWEAVRTAGLDPTVSHAVSHAVTSRFGLKGMELQEALVTLGLHPLSLPSPVPLPLPPTPPNPITLIPSPSSPPPRQQQRRARQLPIGEVDYRPEYEELQRAFGRLHGGRGTVTLAAVERYRLWRNRRKENTLSRARFLVLASREVPSAKQGAGLVHLFTFNPTLDEAARLQIDDYIESLWRGGWSSSVREVVNEFGWQDALDYGRGIQASGRPVSVGRSAPEDDGRFGDVLHFNGTGKP